MSTQKALVTKNVRVVSHKGQTRGFVAAKGRHTVSRSAILVRASKEPQYQTSWPADMSNMTFDDYEPEPPSAMNFNGFVPELINGRLAQVGFVAGLGAELSTHQSLLTQAQQHPMALPFACFFITAASFIPAIKANNQSTSNPESVQDQGVFNVDAERMNGRVAMLGMAAFLATEAMKGGAPL